MKVINTDEYGQLICHWFNREFFQVANISNGDLLEIITNLILSTKENRYGPMPLPEQLVVIRDVIRKSIELNLPIPMLTGWGGRKPYTSSSVDCAEVFAFNQILTLNRLVKQYYLPGIMVNLRVEDAGAYWLYRREEENRKAVETYVSDLQKLLRIIQNEQVINIKLESEMMDEDVYFATSLIYSELLTSVITKQMAFPGINIHSIAEYKELEERGWKGVIPDEQRNHYIERYKRLSPGLEESQYVKMLADYFGGSKARYDMNGTGKPETPVGNHIQFTFVPPVPGAPVSMFSNAVYWRTVPLSQGRTHIPAWRAKGYFKVKGNEALCKITSFNDCIVDQLIPSTTVLKKNGESLEIATDYLLE
jgi:hypothetical protein